MNVKSKLFAILAVMLLSLGAMAQAFGPSSGGGISSAVVCLLAGGADCVMTGQIRAASGSAGTPGFGFASDAGNNTGWFLVAADTMGATAGGTERVRIDSSAMSNQGATGSFNIHYAAGSTATPTYAFAGDANLGALRLAADVYGVNATNGFTLVPGSALAIGATDTTTALTGAGSSCRMSAASPASTWTPAETSAQNGVTFCCTNTGTNTITMTDSAGVYEGSGSVVGQWDTVCFEYVTDRWVEKSFKDN